MTERKRTNLSPASKEKRIRELAVMDWANLPTSEIKERFSTDEDISYQTLTIYRATDLYKEVMVGLREEWDKEMLRLPGTSDLKKKISHGMSLSLNVLIEILAGRAQYKDKISAARLMAQLDGRFLKMGEDGESPKEVESVAKELIHALRIQ
jgi:hypothetical protein